MKSEPKNPHAQILSRARWDKSPKQERSEIARKAALKRWANATPEKKLAYTANARAAKAAKFAEKQGK
jgi:hypothetical protein